MRNNTGMATHTHRRRFEVWQHGFNVGTNNADHWYLSVHRRMRGARFEYEWHNYPTHSDTLFVSVGVAHPKEHKWWAFSLGIWPPEYTRLSNFLRRRFPSYVYRRY